METEPNARVLDEKGNPIAYAHVGPGDSLKVMHKAKRHGGWLEYSPANIMVWLNGQPLSTLQKLVFTIGDEKESLPRVQITLNLDEVDIDADTLTALEAIVKTKKLKEAANAKPARKTH